MKWRMNKESFAFAELEAPEKIDSRPSKDLELYWQSMSKASNNMHSTPVMSKSDLVLTI